MKDFILIACGAGLRDGMSPCMVMSCAVFVIYGFWLIRLAAPLSRLRFAFVLAYGIGILLFNFGPGQTIVFQKSFFVFSRCVYFILSILAFVLGVLFFKDWVSERRGIATGDVRLVGKTKSSFMALIGLGLLTVLLGTVLSALATFVPIDQYLMILGNLGTIRKQWDFVYPMFAVYVLVSMWPLWLMWCFLSVKNLKVSLLKIVCAAVFFTASSCMILIFK